MNQRSMSRFASTFMVALASATGVGGCLFEAGTTTGVTGGTGGGTNATTTTSSGDPATFDQPCADYATAYCSARDACTASYVTLVNYADVATCVARTKDQCVRRSIADGVAATPDKVEQCASDLPSFNCNDLFSNLQPASCIPAPGGLDDDAGCAFSAQCASGFCQSDSSSACGYCAPMPKGGDDCNVDADCGSSNGLRCDQTTFTCAVYGDAGATCDDPAGCKDGDSCVALTGQTNGTCEASVTTVGDPCDSTGVSAPNCDTRLGLRCVQGACTDVTYAGGGDACGTINGHVAICEATGTCTGATGAKTCVAAAADGSPCDQTNGPKCLSPARCVVSGAGTVGICTLLDASQCQ